MIKGALKSVEYICSGLTSVEIDCGARSDRCGGGRGLLAQDQYQLTYIWYGSLSVWGFWVGIDVS